MPYRSGDIEEHIPIKLADLPKYTQEFLKDLREEDVDELKEAMQFMKSVKTVSRFMKWLIITGVSVFVATVSFGEGIMKFKGWFK